jgi:hypothetical protein
VALVARREVRELRFSALEPRVFSLAPVEVIYIAHITEPGVPSRIELYHLRQEHVEDCQIVVIGIVAPEHWLRHRYERQLVGHHVGSEKNRTERALGWLPLSADAPEVPGNERRDEPIGEMLRPTRVTGGDLIVEVVVSQGLNGSSVDQLVEALGLLRGERLRFGRAVQDLWRDRFWEGVANTGAESKYGAGIEVVPEFSDETVTELGLDGSRSHGGTGVANAGVNAPSPNDPDPDAAPPAPPAATSASPAAASCGSGAGSAACSAPQPLHPAKARLSSAAARGITAPPGLP